MFEPFFFDISLNDKGEIADEIWDSGDVVISVLIIIFKFHG